MGESGPAVPRGRILLIDDDRVFGLWATKVLQARGFEIQHVLDPVTGLRQVESESWDLVITDVEMPRMTGLEFLERARRLDPDLPVAVVTAHPTVDRAVTTMRQVATEFISKPITPGEFAARVIELAGQRRSRPAGEPEGVLAIGAHPGDVEIGAAGTLLAHLAAGLSVTVLELAPAASGNGGAPDQAGAPAPDIGTRVSLDDLVPGTEPGRAAAAIDKIITRTRPAVLYTHSVHDANPEHRGAHLAAVAAAWRVPSVYGFQSPSATVDFRPAHFVAIDDHIDVKLTVATSLSAQPEVREYLESGQITSTARYWARYCQAQHAEAFEIIRARAATRDVPGTLGRIQAAP